MLTVQEIKKLIDRDKASTEKKKAAVGQKYYDGKHDILDYRLFYYDGDGNLKEDKTRSNVKIPHPFFTELVDEAVQLILSGEDGIVHSDDPKLQNYMDEYFNNNKKFMAELTDTVTGMQVKGFDYMHVYLDKDGQFTFENADAMNVIEVDGNFVEDGQDQYIWTYSAQIDADGKYANKILVIDNHATYYYLQNDNGEIVEDPNVELNPKFHETYVMEDAEGNEVVSYKESEIVPFVKLMNNKRGIGQLDAVKPLIDDYDVMASSLSNNLIDFDTPIHVVKGFKGDNLDELQQNLKTKKTVGVGENGGIETLTVDIPYDARKVKLELDEKNIYRFGMGLNLSGLKDTAATTNIAIKAAYSLLELRCNKMIIQLELFMEQLVEIALQQINENNETAYDITQIYYNFDSEIMANATENAENDLKEAQRQQTVINTLLSLAEFLDNETLMKEVCDVLDIDYEEIKDKLPDPDEAYNDLEGAKNILGGEVVE